MDEVFDEFCFPLETLDNRSSHGDLGNQHLNGDSATDLYLFGFEYCTEASFTEFSTDLVTSP